MRSIARMGLLVAVLSSASVASAREVYTIPDARPTSIRPVKEALRGGGPKESIPEYLEAAQCGGWDKDIDVGDNGLAVSGYMSKVFGVPGREHWWAGDIRSGMGTRYDNDDEGDDVDDQYEYPTTAEGLATACEQKKSSIEKDVWEWKQDWESYDPDTWQFLGWISEYELKKRRYQYPYFEDPACRWRMEGNAMPKWPLQPDDPDPPLPFNKNFFEFEDPPTCQNFCEYLNSFVYRDCLDPKLSDEFWTFVGWDRDGFPQFAPLKVWTCDEEDRGLKYICTDEKVEEEDRLQACDRPHPDLEEWANARKCVGEQCRCGKEGPGAGDDANDECVHIEEDEQRAPYQSFFRRYSGVSYSRSELAKYVPEDEESKAMEVACYGFYDEFDPKVKRTENKDRRCVINVDVQDMKQTQKGKGEYKEGGVQDKDPTAKENQRAGGPEPGDVPPPPGAPPVPGEYNKFVDTWYQKLGSAFSFVNEKLFAERYDSDLSNVYLAYDELDDGVQHATPQINDQDLLAESNLMRAFDDTGNPRAYTRWWQAQQTNMAAIMRAPVLRVVLPSAWFLGLDPNDPFISSEGGTEDPTERADRSDRIELQIEADEDVLGTALAYLERSVLLHVEEEPIPVVVPMGSPVEFRARAGDWCEWYKATNGAENCDDAPEKLKELIERLEEYAQRIDDVRELRAELAETAGATLALQRRLLEPIATWFRENEQALIALVQGRERAERELLPVWNRAQAGVRQMHERSNLPWCMNQRFTAPMYTMLDPWLPSRARQGAPTNELGLPVLPTVDRLEDVIIDFSAVSAMSGTIKIPVLKPVQIRIEIPTPPSLAELAELPDIGRIHEAMEDVLGELPEIDNRLGNTPLPKPPPPLSPELLSDARATLGAIETVVRGMNDRYEKFWKSIGPLEPGVEQFERQIEFKTRLKCRDWNTMPCEHVEMDLWERIQRIGSRPLVQLKHDFQSIGTPRTEPTVCLPEDDACHILNAERTDPGFRWEIRGSSSNDAPIDELRTTIIELTQPPPLGDVDPLLLYPHDDDPAPLQAFPVIRLLP